jgi:hypothetical protein
MYPELIITLNVFDLACVIIAVGFGEPWISGNVNLLQGKVDLKFRIEGSKGEPRPLRLLPLYSSTQLDRMLIVILTSRRVCVLCGPVEKATVYFTSIRPTENAEFQIGKFQVPRPWSS